MYNLTFKKPIIRRAWRLSGLILDDPNVILKQIGVMSTPELEAILEEYHSLDISLRPTPTTLIAHKQFSSYINNRLASAINKTIELSPTVARVIEKRDKV
jgi:hypothetical protein